MSERPTGPSAGPWRSMAGDPVRFLCSSWPWRSLAYLITGGMLGLALLWVLALMILAGAVLTVVLVGLAVLVWVTLSGIPVAAVERWRLRLMGVPALPSPHVRLVRPGPARRMRVRLREPATWRELAYTLLFALLLSIVDTVVVAVALTVSLFLVFMPLWVVLVGEPIRLTDDYAVTGPLQGVPVSLIGVVVSILFSYLVTVLAAAQAGMARLLLAPREEELSTRVHELSRSRARLVDAFQAERRRIERDLHDGAQQRLVALTMTLGLAELELSGVDGEGPRLVARARTEARDALASLRELVRGVHPQVLTDRGVAAAVEEVAARCPVPTSVDIALPGRLPAEVESAAYFVTTEALANAVRHARAGRIAVLARLTHQQLVLSVTDDGVGGADPTRGTGLTGLADRVAVVDGRLVLDSPSGGPTVLRVEIPCSTISSG